MSDIKTKILQWLATGETGVSSRAIAFQMCGIEKENLFYTYPFDPDDFKRCLKLINLIPEIRPRLDEMRPISIEWDAIIEHWREVEDCFMGEVSEWLKNDYSKKAHKTFELMRKIYYDARNK